MEKDNYELSVEKLYNDTVNEINLIEQKDPRNKHLPLLKKRQQKLGSLLKKIKEASVEELKEVPNFEQQVIASQKDVSVDDIRLRKASTINYASPIFVPSKTNQQNTKPETFAEILNKEIKRK